MARRGDLSQHELSNDNVQACIFLKDKACIIHSVRPRQCSTYPWWPDLIDGESWDQERDSVCEGMDHGDASPCDPVEVAHQLNLATLHFAAREAAHYKNKKR